MTSRKTDGENESNTLTAAPDVNAPPRFLYRTVVKVLVGSEEKAFDLHKELLCSTSKFFAAAFGGRFKEAEVGVIKLPEQKVETFEYFVHWLYRRKLTGYFRAGTSPSIRELITTTIAKANLYKTTALPADLKAVNDSLTATNLAAFEDAPFHQLIPLYILADALQICGLKDYIISLLIKVYGIKPSCATRFWAIARRPDPVPDPSLAINHAYERLPQSSLLKRVLVELYLDELTAEVLTFNRGSLNHDFVYDTLEALYKRRLVNSPMTRWNDDSKICQFHEHDVTCPLTTRNIWHSEITEW